MTVWEALLRKDLHDVTARAMRDMVIVPRMLFSDDLYSNFKSTKPAWETPRLIPTNPFRLWAYLHGEECGECGC